MKSDGSNVSVNKCTGDSQHDKTVCSLRGSWDADGRGLSAKESRALQSRLLSTPGVCMEVSVSIRRLRLRPAELGREGAVMAQLGSFQREWEGEDLAW